MTDWKIGLASWIIQDGNYGDFRCHEQAEFALECYPVTCQPSSSSDKHARWLYASRYKVNAEVIFVDKRCFVIDFGVPAYRDAYREAEVPKSIRKGSWLEAEIYLGVDPFFYPTRGTMTTVTATMSLSVRRPMFLRNVSADRNFGSTSVFADGHLSGPSC